MNCTSFAPQRPIENGELRAWLGEVLSGVRVRGKRVLAIVPDDTRTLPMPTVFEAIASTLGPEAASLSVLIALGTHPQMTENELERHLGSQFRSFRKVQILQHRWEDTDTLALAGVISRDEVAAISGGLLQEEVPVSVNRAVLDHDLALLVGPVFPHEVVGFSGGHKYLFPGVSGPDMVNTSHWLGALITNPKVCGNRDTPVRALVERAAQFVPTERMGVSLVMQGHELMGLFAGDVHESWTRATELSAELNIVWVDRSYQTVLSIAPPMYRELWTAGKCMYKLEPIVEDGGTLIIYAPDLHGVSVTHARSLLDVGYHTRDYFLAQWGRYRDVPRGVLAHSTQVKGIGTYRGGVERPRVEVVLATGMPADVCRRINLGYRDPASVRPEEYEGRQDEGVLAVPNAGEKLWRLKGGRVPDIDRL